MKAPKFLLGYPKPWVLAWFRGLGLRGLGFRVSPPESFEIFGVWSKIGSHTHTVAENVKADSRALPGT